MTGKGAAAPSGIRNPNAPVIHVACGVLVDGAGRVLLAQRPEGKIAAGWWEFPGGKIETGEGALDALTRELAEELGVVVRAAEPLIRFRHHYSNRTVVLDTWRVTAFDGEPRGCEGQTLRWLAVPDFDQVSPLLPTVTPIGLALRQAAHYVFTPAPFAPEAMLAALPALPRGAWLRLRQPQLDGSAYEALARMVLPVAQAQGFKVLLDRESQRAAALGADGWHASSAALMALRQRPAGPQLCVASVHDAAQLDHAEALGFDATVLGPVQPTATHPAAAVLGWPGFAALRADRPLPVLAIGGLGAAQLNTARAANAQGIAGISAYWALGS